MNWFQSILKWLQGTSTRAQSEPMPKQSRLFGILKPTPPKSKRVKLAVIVGHNSRSRGAQGIGILQEYYYNEQLALSIVALSKLTSVDVMVFHRNPVLGYEDEIEDVYERSDGWGADLSVELHYNSHDSSAHGCETLHASTVKSRRWAGVVHQKMIKAMGNRDRGLKLRMRGHGRGWLSMYAGNAPACLIEPAFGSHPSDAALLRDKESDIAKAVVEAAIEYGS